MASNSSTGRISDTADSDPRKQSASMPDKELSSDDTLPAREAAESPANSDDADTTADHDVEKSSPAHRTISTMAESMSAPHEFLFVSIMCLCQFCTQIGLGQCLSIIHVIGDYYGLTNPGDLSWLIAGYSLTVGTFILLSGRMGDIFGYKRMLLIGFGWWALWSMVAGLAHYSNHVLFVFARVFQGIGPSICLPNGLAILGATYRPGRKKNIIFACFGATAPGGSIVGSLFAAIFAQLAHAWWWAFYAFAIALVIIGVVASFVVPDPPPSRAAENAPSVPLWQKLDLLGGGVGVLALILFNFAWNQAGVVGWDSAYVCVCLVLGVLLLPAFIYIEKRVASDPLVPFDILTADVAFVLACVGCGWGSFGVWVYYIWQYFLTIRNLGPLLATAWICPVAVTGACAAILTGFLLSKLRAAWVMTFAMCGFLTGIILVGTVPANQIYWGQIFVTTLIIVTGMDFSFPAATIIVSNALPREKQGVGASLVNTVVNYSISLALGFAGTVEANVNDGDELKGYRGAFYFGMGLSGFGLFISVIYLIRSYVRHEDFRGGAPAEKKEEE